MENVIIALNLGISQKIVQRRLQILEKHLDLGAEYLVFVSSRSLKTREKYTN